MVKPNTKNSLINSAKKASNSLNGINEATNILNSIQNGKNGYERAKGIAAIITALS